MSESPEPFADKLDFNPDTEGVPDEITVFAEKEIGDDWDQEFADLLNFLNKFFQHRMVMDSDGNPAAVIPHYSSSELDDINTEEWVNQTNDDADPAIIKDGLFVRVKKE